MPLSDSQEHILDAAMSCIAREGVEGTSLRAVAREADVSLGLLSYHFDDKRSLIVESFRLATQRLLESSLAAINEIESPADRVRAFIRGAFTGDYLEADYLALRTALWAISRTDPELAEVEANLYHRYEAQLLDLIRTASPTLTADDAAARATDVIVNQNGLWLNWARYRHEADLERGLARCEQIALDRN